MIVLVGRLFVSDPGEDSAQHIHLPGLLGLRALIHSPGRQSIELI